MTDRPILFSAPMVRAILEGRKSQTRRLAWRQVVTHPDCPKSWRHGEHRSDGYTYLPTLWQKVEPGDRFYVQEATTKSGGLVQYVADRTTSRHLWPAHWKRDPQQSRFMFKKFSRLTIVVDETRIQRVQEITDSDAKAEGVTEPDWNSCGWGSAYSLRGGFGCLWDSLHKPGSRWHDNPEVVAISFTVHKTNIDHLKEVA